MAVATGAVTPLTPAPAPAGAVAVFDLDRTLVPGSSLSMFGQAAVAEGFITRWQLARFALSEASFRRGGLSDARLERVCRGLLDLARGHPYQPLLALAESVAIRIVARMYSGARLLVDHHLRAGDTCVVLSASPQPLVSAVAGTIGADVAIGTELEVEDDRLTGRLGSTFCYGQGKVDRLTTILGPRGIVDAVAYADSGSDLALLRAVRRPVAVNPDRRLWAAADAAAWPILRFD